MNQQETFNWLVERSNRVDELEADNTRLRRELDEWQEREAKVCPEDFSFEEVISALRNGFVKNQLPGLVAKHAIVSDECRVNRGDMAAAHEAATRLIDEYRECYPQWKDKGARFHFILTIERPTPHAPSSEPPASKNQNLDSQVTPEGET